MTRLRGPLKTLRRSPAMFADVGDFRYRILARDRQLKSWAVGYIGGIISFHHKEAESWNQALKLLKAVSSQIPRDETARDSDPLAG